MSKASKVILTLTATNKPEGIGYDICMDLPTMNVEQIGKLFGRCMMVLNERARNVAEMMEADAAGNAALFIVAMQKAMVPEGPLDAEVMLERAKQPGIIRPPRIGEM